MIKQALLGEFLHEAENTRKLLRAVPDSALDYRPQPFLWSIAELATHIATIYAWYEGVFSVDVFNFDTFHYEHPDHSKMANMNDWTMKNGDAVLIGPMQKMHAIRGFLYNHLYHHRGELVAHLRASGNKVPGLYGPTFEQSKGRS